MGAGVVGHVATAAVPHSVREDGTGNARPDPVHRPWNSANYARQAEITRGLGTAAGRSADGRTYSPTCSCGNSSGDWLFGARMADGQLRPELIQELVESASPRTGRRRGQRRTSKAPPTTFGIVSGHLSVASLLTHGHCAGSAKTRTRPASPALRRSARRGSGGGLRRIHDHRQACESAEDLAV